MKPSNMCYLYSKDCACIFLGSCSSVGLVIGSTWRWLSEVFLWGDAWSHRRTPSSEHPSGSRHISPSTCLWWSPNPPGSEQDNVIFPSSTSWYQGHNNLYLRTSHNNTYERVLVCPQAPFMAAFRRRAKKQLRVFSTSPVWAKTNHFMICVAIEYSNTWSPAVFF